MRFLFLIIVFFAVAFSLMAEKQPYERYQSIVDRQMFGKIPPGFDPTKPPTEVTKRDQKELTQEQEKIQSAIHFSMINITPDGATAVGFTDNSVNPAVHYYLKVGERRNGWEVKEADAVKATMTIVKDDVEVSLELGANSAKGSNASLKDSGNSSARSASGGPRKGLGFFKRSDNGDPEGRPLLFGGQSLKDRRAAREQERQKQEEESKRKAEQEKAQREQEREEQRRELQSLKDELKQQREEAAAEKAERERKSSEKNGEEAAADENNDA